MTIHTQDLRLKATSWITVSEQKATTQKNYSYTDNICEVKNHFHEVKLLSEFFPSEYCQETPAIWQA